MNIEKFSNKKPEDITSFFQQLNRAATSRSFGDQLKIVFLPGYLTAVPEKFIEASWNANSTRTYRKWKELLVNRFRPKECICRKREELANVSLVQGQDVEDFFDKILEVFQEIDPLMSEEAKIVDIQKAI